MSEVLDMLENGVKVFWLTEFLTLFFLIKLNIVLLLRQWFRERL